MKQIGIVFSFIVLLLLAGCTNTESPSTSTSQLYITAPAITPLSNSVTVDAYPAPAVIAAYPGVDPVPVVSERIILDTGFPLDAPVPTPNVDRTSVTGHIVFKSTGAPLINVPVVLAQIYRNEEDDGAFVYDSASSPYALTDDNGRFIFTDVEPTEFVFVVGNVEVNRYELLTEPDGSSRIINLPAGQILDLGVVEVELEW